MNPLAFPLLDADGYAETHPESDVYNCIAWAAGRSDSWWWPEEDDAVHWPEKVPREETIEAFTAVFVSLGYEVCHSGEWEAGWERVALYALDGLPKHAARQLPDGRWTSKLGPGPVITHTTPRGVEGPVYGIVCCYLRRPVPAPPA
jgi:hypothetical protein